MCQYQLSSDMLPSEAPMPPWAATVCERVGKTLDRTATFRPASASCSEARMPEPPAPTMTASKRRVVMADLIAATISFSTESARRSSATDQPHDSGNLQDQTNANGLDVVHQRITHADPGVEEQRHEHGKGGDLEPLMREQRRPA